MKRKPTPNQIETRTAPLHGSDRIWRIPKAVAEIWEADSIVNPEALLMELGTPRGQGRGHLPPDVAADLQVSRTGGVQISRLATGTLGGWVFGMFFGIGAGQTNHLMLWSALVGMLALGCKVGAWMGDEP